LVSHGLCLFEPPYCSNLTTDLHLTKENGAKVVVGDLRLEEISAQSSKFGDSLRFVRCNVASYQDQLNLFKTAQDNFGSVDVAIANAGTGKFPDPIVSIENILEEPSIPEVDVNLRGALFTARIAVHYMRQNGSGDLILTSSMGGFKETIGLTPYVASKHGVIGIMRGLRLTTIKDNIRVNVVCPWMTCRPDLNIFPD
jgi:NAD(P)-dependent dehydrogenase (short-subunit alcohol dehydrogenase family)